MSLLEFALRFFVGAMLLTGLWCVVVYGLVRALRIRSPNARFILFLAPLLAAAAVRFRLMPDDHLLVLAICGVVALALLTIDLGSYVLYARSLLRDTRPSPRLQRLLNRVTQRFGIAPLPALLHVGAYSGPCVLGYRRPRIIVPQAVADALSDAELTALLAHEVAHVSRRDGWSKWALLVVRRVAFWNPLVLLPLRWIELEMERASDRLAAAKLQCRGALARALCKVYDLAESRRKAPVSALPIVRADTHLGVRVQALADIEITTSHWLTLAKTAFAFVVLFQICLRPAELFTALL